MRNYVSSNQFNILKQRKVNERLVGRAMYSKHPHIRTLISGFRLIVFLFITCLVRNQRMCSKIVLKIVSETHTLYIRSVINIQCLITCTKKINFYLKKLNAINNISKHKFS